MNLQWPGSRYNYPAI